MIKGVLLDTAFLDQNYIPIKVQNLKKGDKIKSIDTDIEIKDIKDNFEETYTIVPEDRGEQYHLSKNFVLPLRNLQTNEIEYKSIKELITDKKLDNGLFIHNYKLIRSSFEYNQIDLEIDPYFLGLLIGDKKSIKSGEEKWNEIRKIYNYQGNLVYKENIILSKDNIFNSSINRLLLLAGIIDSNAIFEQGSNSFEVEFLDETISDNIVFLSRSLGLGAGKRNIYKFNGVKIVRLFRIYIYGNISVIPTKILIVNSENNQSSKEVSFTIYYHRLGEVYQLQFDEEDKRVITNGFDILSF